MERDDQNSSTSRPGRTFLSAVIWILAGGCFLAVVWSFGPRTVEYPGVVSTGLGLLLAALTFFLGFARENNRRSTEALLQSFKTSHEAWIRYAVGHQGAKVSLMRLRLGAEILSDAVRRLEKYYKELREGEHDATASKLHRWSDLYAERVELLYQGAFNRVGAQQDPPDDRKLQRRRAVNTRRIEERLHAVQRQFLTMRGMMGYGRSALMARAAARLSRTVLTLMLLLFVAGLLTARDPLGAVLTPAFWVAILFVVAAFIYANHTSRNLRIEQDAALLELEELPLVHLWLLERMIALTSEDGTLENIARRIETEYMDRVQRLERLTPGHPWLRSIRGRLYLSQWLHDPGETRSRHLAVLDLRSAVEDADDPVTMVALARAIEKDAVSTEAQDLVASALRLLNERSEPFYCIERSSSGSHTLSTARLLDAQRWFWPATLTARFPERNALSHAQAFD